MRSIGASRSRSTILDNADDYHTRSISPIPSAFEGLGFFDSPPLFGRRRLARPETMSSTGSAE